MSDPTYKLCDICGEAVDADHRLFLPQRDAERKPLDLCQFHMADAMRSLVLANADVQTSEGIMNWVSNHEDNPNMPF